MPNSIGLRPVSAIPHAFDNPVTELPAGGLVKLVKHEPGKSVCLIAPTHVARNARSRADLRVATGKRAVRPARRQKIG